MNITAPALITDVYLKPGEFYFGDSHARIRTLLGSCVSITFWHPKHHIGGMCHYMLPYRSRKGDDELNGKYGDEAMEMFISAATRYGTRAREYEVKLFGGGSMMKAFGRQSMVESVAQRNVLQARQLMVEHGVAIKAECLGGVGYRQLVFELWSGDVWSRNVRGVLNMDGGGAE